MIEQLQLIVPLSQIEKEINDKINIGHSLLAKDVINETDYNELKQENKKWINESLLILQRSFNLPNNMYENDFYVTWPSIYTIPGMTKPLTQRVKDEKDIILHKLHSLHNSLKVLKISDAIVNPSKVNTEERNKYTVDQKLMLIISKLYELDDDNYYSIKDILNGNGIYLKNFGDYLEYGKMLENYGYVDIYGGLGGDCNIKLKIEGRMFYEQNIKPNLEKDKNMEDEPIKIFISHGRNSLWKDVARFVENKLNFEVVSLQEQSNKGRTIIEKLEDETSDCDFAIIIMTAEDEQLDGNMRARQNVIHEIGFCQGVFGRGNVLVLKQKGVEGFTNISGLVYEEFDGDNIKSTFEKIRQELDELEEELNSDDED